MLATGCSALRPNTLGDLAGVEARPLAADIGGQLDRDRQRLRALAAQLRELDNQRQDVLSRICCNAADEGRKYFTCDEEDFIDKHWALCLQTRRELLDLVAACGDYESQADAAVRARRVLVGCAAAVMSYELDLKVVDHPCAEGRHAWQLRRKLNEPRRYCGVPRGAFDMICQSAASSANDRRCREWVEQFQEASGTWGQQTGWPAGDVAELAEGIGESWAFVRDHRDQGAPAWRAAILDSAAESAFVPIYLLQEAVSRSISSTHPTRDSCVQAGHVAQAAKMLQPGDILIVRRHGNLTNRFIPGFWIHAEIYAGTEEDLRRLGIADRPAVAENLPEYRKPAADGTARTVIEARAAGVIFSSLAEAMDDDWVVALRPRLPRAEVAQAVEKAFGYYGLPYDFDYDAFTADRVTCAELAFRIYQDVLDCRPQRIWGRDIVVCDDFVRAFQQRRGSQDSRLDFVFLILGDPETGEARFAAAEDIP